MEGMAKVTVCVDGKEVRELEGNCVFLVVAKSEGKRGVQTNSAIIANANANTIGRAIVEMEEKLEEVKRENPVIGSAALGWKFQLADKRAEKLIKDCDKILAGDDDE